LIEPQPEALESVERAEQDARRTALPGTPLRLGRRRGCPPQRLAARRSASRRKRALGRRQLRRSGLGQHGRLPVVAEELASRAGLTTQFKPVRM
jgi:hypothetical protein